MNVNTWLEEFIKELTSTPTGVFASTKVFQPVSGFAFISYYLGRSPKATAALVVEAVEAFVNKERNNNA